MKKTHLIIEKNEYKALEMYLNENELKTGFFQQKIEKSVLKEQEMKKGEMIFFKAQFPGVTVNFSKKMSKLFAIQSSTQYSV